MLRQDTATINPLSFQKRTEINCFLLTWPTKSELRCAYYGRNKARIFNGAIDSANLKKFTLNQLHLLAK
jgi:hypothetical protein